MFSLKGLNAVITGGTSGIGFSTAQRFLAAGAQVVIAGRKGGDEAVEKLGGGHFCKTDVGKEEDVEALMKFANDKLGGIDLVINCAGVNRGYNTLLETSKDDFDFNISVNTMGVVFGIKHAVPYMKNGGSIINVASAAAVAGVPYLAPYVASKWAVIGITRTAALELGDKNIRVNAVCPTSVDTPMARAEGGESQLAMEERAVPLGRIAQPEEVSALLHFLAAPDCQFVNGQAISVDGGFSAGLSIAAFDQLAAGA